MNVDDVTVLSTKYDENYTLTLLEKQDETKPSIVVSNKVVPYYSLKGPSLQTGPSTIIVLSGNVTVHTLTPYRGSISDDLVYVIKDDKTYTLSDNNLPQGILVNIPHNVIFYLSWNTPATFIIAGEVSVVGKNINMELAECSINHVKNLSKSTRPKFNL